MDASTYPWAWLAHGLEFSWKWEDYATYEIIDLLNVLGGRDPGQAPAYELTKAVSMLVNLHTESEVMGIIRELTRQVEDIQ
jgi:hypothetical protein